MNEDEQLALALSLSLESYNKEQGKTDRPIHFVPPVDREYDEDFLTTKTFIKNGMGAFFFPEEQMQKNAESHLGRQLSRSCPEFHRALLTLESILSNLDSSVDVSDLYTNINAFERQYEDFLASPLCSQMTRQDGVLENLNSRLKPIFEHPVVLIKRTPPSSWQSIMALVGILNKYRTKALLSCKRGASRAKDSERLDKGVKDLKSYLEKANDSNQIIYQNIEPARVLLENTFKEMSKKLTVWHPADYPDALAGLDKCFKEHGQVIRMAELSIDPEFALSKSVLQAVVLFDLGSRFENSHQEGYRNWLFRTVEDVEMWPKEKVINAANLMLGHDWAIQIIAKNFPKDRLRLTGLSKKQAVSLPNAQFNAYQVADRNINRTSAQAQSADLPDLTSVIVNVNNSGGLEISDVALPKTLVVGLIGIKELNLPHLLNLPKSSWESAIDYYFNHVNDQLTKPPSLGYLCKNSEIKKRAEAAVKLPKKIKNVSSIYRAIADSSSTSKKGFL